MYTCYRFRGFVDADGNLPLEYYQVWVAKLAFIIVFEVSASLVELSDMKCSSLPLARYIPTECCAGLAGA